MLHRDEIESFRHANALIWFIIILATMLLLALHIVGLAMTWEIVISPISFGIVFTSIHFIILEFQLAIKRKEEERVWNKKHEEFIKSLPQVLDINRALPRRRRK